MDMQSNIYHIDGKAFEVTMDYVVIGDGWLFQSNDYDLDLDLWEPCEEVSVH